jgi:hypothetical protein
MCSDAWGLARGSYCLACLGVLSRSTCFDSRMTTVESSSYARSVGGCREVESSAKSIYFAFY